MKKYNNKGFMLTETLVVSTVIVSILIYIYIQFTNIYNSYEKSFMYNTVDGLYGASNIRDFLQSDNINGIINDNSLTNNYYVNLSSFDSYTEKTYQLKLFNFLDIKEAIITLDDLTDIKNNINDLSLSEGLKDFIKYTKTNGEANTYRIFISYNNNTFACIKLSMEV